MDYESDEYDTVADISENIINELKENYQLNCISRFKEHISHEPEFYGINNISSFRILEILKNPKKIKSNKRFYVSEYQYELLEDVCGLVFNKSFSRCYYVSVVNEIFNEIYV